MTAYRRRMHGAEPEIDWNWLPVRKTEHITQIFDVIFPKITSQRPCPFTGCTGPHVPVTVCGTTLIDSIGGETSISWRNTPPRSPNVIVAIVRYRHGASGTEIVILKNADPGRNYGSYGKNCNTVSKTAGY